MDARPVQTDKGGRVSILMFSGTAGKFVLFGDISRAAAAMDLEKHLR